MIGPYVNNPVPTEEDYDALEDQHDGLRWKTSAGQAVLLDRRIRVAEVEFIGRPGAVAARLLDYDSELVETDMETAKRIMRDRYLDHARNARYRAYMDREGQRKRRKR